MPSWFPIDGQQTTLRRVGASCVRRGGCSEDSAENFDVPASHTSAGSGQRVGPMLASRAQARRFRDAARTGWVDFVQFFCALAGFFVAARGRNLAISSSSVAQPIR